MKGAANPGVSEYRFRALADELAYTKERLAVVEARLAQLASAQEAQAARLARETNG